MPIRIKWIDKNIFLFLIGFCVYISLEVIARGYSFPVMGICGGLACVILDKINSKISWDTDLLVQCICGSLLITLFELIIGIGVTVLNCSPMWDYSAIPFNFMGIICLPFSILWIFLSLLAILVADGINYYVYNEMPIPYYKLFGKVVIKFTEK